MDYFTAIVHRCEELDKLGQSYLDRFDFIPNDELVDRIYQAAKKIFIDANEDWNKVPEWVATTMDGAIPYSAPPRNGSLFVSLGWSMTSNDAHLRNLLEIAEGRETKELDFPVLAEHEIVDKLSEIKPKSIHHKLN